MNDRRRDARVSINLPAKWDGVSGTREARIEDLSLGGCFVNTTGRVDPGELVVLDIKLPTGEWLRLSGKVAAYHEGIGFGMLFTILTDEEEKALRETIG